ncbi:hypothetical protein PIB30_103236, partial [Stylosanthes scabra]|nr:hypothetical protein [Stylosanthes scabra]
MANLNKNQTEFYDNMLAQQAAYGLRLQDLETRQKDMWEEQEKLHRELMNHRKNFSTHMGKVHTAQEQNKQGFPSLVPITPSKILGAIRNNFREGKPLFEGMLRPWPPEGSTSAVGQQDPLMLRNPFENPEDHRQVHRIVS